MCSKEIVAVTLGAALAAGLVTPAVAQEAAARNSVGERMETALGRRPSTTDGLSALVTGYEDLILLDKRKFFTAWATVSPQYSSNAPLASGGGDDFFAVVNTGVRAATRLADTVDVHADLGVLSSWYQDLDDLDYSAFTASFGAGRTFSTEYGQLTTELGYSPAVIYDSGFSDRQQTRHQIAGVVQLFSPLGEFAPLAGYPVARDMAVVPTLILEQVYTDPEEYRYHGLSLDIALIYRPWQNWQFGASVGSFIRDYDDYFEGIVGDSRRDDGYRGAVFAQWSPREFIMVNVGADFADNDSTSDVNDYHVKSITPGATFSMRF